MAVLTIRNLDDEIKTKLRMQAALHGQSMEEEVRSILRQAFAPAAVGGLGQRLQQRFAQVPTELTLPERNLPRQAPTW
jgi:plasmid stability protein